MPTALASWSRWHAPVGFFLKRRILTKARSRGRAVQAGPFPSPPVRVFENPLILVCQSAVWMTAKEKEGPHLADKCGPRRLCTFVFPFSNVAAFRRPSPCPPAGVYSLALAGCSCRFCNFIARPMLPVIFSLPWKKACAQAKTRTENPFSGSQMETKMSASIFLFLLIDR